MGEGRAALDAAVAASGFAIAFDGHAARVTAAGGERLADLDVDDLVRRTQREPSHVAAFLLLRLAALSIEAVAAGSGPLARHVRLRVRARRDGAVYDASLPTFDVLPGTTTLIMCDVGAQLASVHDASWSGRAAADRRRVFTAALDTTLAAAVTTRNDLRTPSGAPITAWTGDEHITSTLAHAVERLLPADPRWGALVAVPRSQSVVAHAIADHQLVGVASHLAMMARGIYTEGPDPRVSPRVYWVRGVHVEALDLDVDLATRRVTRFAPSQRFTDDVLLPLAGDHLRPV
jgi:hypothetical protein